MQDNNARRRPMKCSVPGCHEIADLKVWLEDDYGHGIKFHKPDTSCRRLCNKHAVENEAQSTGLGRARQYPFTKGGRAGSITGWTTYEDIRTGRATRIADEHGLPFDK